MNPSWSTIFDHSYERIAGFQSRILAFCFEQHALESRQAASALMRPNDQIMTFQKSPNDTFIMRLITISAFILTLITDASHAQSSLSAGSATQAIALGSARQKVFDALRKNDAAAAKAAIDLAIAARTDEGGVDVSTSEELALLSFGLADGQDRANAQQLANQAIAAAARVEAGPNVKFSPRAALVAAHLYEKVLGDPAKARLAYQRVLALDPANVPAKEGIARIDLEKAIVAEKIKEQLLMQQRKNQSANP